MLILILRLYCFRFQSNAQNILSVWIIEIIALLEYLNRCCKRVNKIRSRYIQGIPGNEYLILYNGIKFSVSQSGRGMVQQRYHFKLYI